MRSHELAKLLLEQPDGEIEISVDVIEFEADEGIRVFADPLYVQFACDDAMIISEGSFNYDRELIQSDGVWKKEI